MKKLIDINTWDRADLYKYYDDHTSPFVSTISEIDITNLYNYCKKMSYSFYATLGYVIVKVANSIETFRLRKEDDKIYLYDKVRTNFTENINDEKIGFFGVDIDGSFKDYIEKFNQTRDDLFNGKLNDVNVQRYDEIWISCQPWFHFNSLSVPYDKRYTIPIVIWDKFKFENNKVFVNLFVMVHHGFADGSHLGRFYNKLQEEINNFKGDED